MNKTCLIYNYAQHYRIGIFKLLDQKLNIDSYFGDKMSDVKKLDYTELKNFKKEVKNIALYKSIYMQSGVINLFFKNYQNYVMLGEYYNLTTWLFLIMCKFSNKKIYLWTHGWYGNESVLKKSIKKIFFRLSDGLFLYGTYAKELMIKEGFNKNTLHVIFNSLHYDEQLKIRKGLKKTDTYKEYFKNSNPVLIFIGRITSVKKIDKLIESIHYLNEDKSVPNLIIIGDGSLITELKTLSKKLNLEDRIWFYGACYDEVKIGELVYNADICVSPGNVGLTAMHTMTYGTPVITHDYFPKQMPEFEAIDRGKTGDFYIYNNYDDLANKISNWLNNTDRDQIRNNCFDKIDKYFNPNYQMKVINHVINEK